MQTHRCIRPGSSHAVLHFMTRGPSRTAPREPRPPEPTLRIQRTLAFIAARIRPVGRPILHLIVRPRAAGQAASHPHGCGRSSSALSPTRRRHHNLPTDEHRSSSSLPNNWRNV